MLPGNDGERRRCDRAENCAIMMICLRLYLSARCPAGSERQTTGMTSTRPTKSERGGGMCAPVNFPLHRYGQHLTADDGEKISRHIEIEIGKAKGGIGIVRRRSDGRNDWRRFVLIHESARAERARERLASGVRVASEVLHNEGRVHQLVVIERKRGHHQNCVDHTS